MMQTKAEKGFYRHALQIAIPIIVQNGITQFVNMIDNVMVGRVGTDPMSGVAIVNELLFVWSLCLFGGLSGIGIFTAQFYGKKDHRGIRYTFRLMLILCAILLVAGILLFRLSGTSLITLFLHEDGGIGNAEATLRFASVYLQIMLIGLIPFAVTQAYGTTLKSMGDTVAPMTASMIAVGLNLLGNYVLIFGKWGAPALGVAGAAIATVLSRFAEMLIMIVYMQKRAAIYSFITGAFRSMYVPRDLVINCIRKGTPLLANEALWACGMAALTQSYSLRGLSVVAAFNISQTISNVFNVVFIAMGSAIGIIIGQELGMGKLDTVRKDADRLIAFAMLISCTTIAAQLAISQVFPQIYNTSPEIRDMATWLIRISALCVPLYAYENAAYFILRSGGKTMITFLFDSCFVWIAPLPLAYVLSRYTAMPIIWLFLCIQLTDAVKCLIGYSMLRKGLWVQDLTNYSETA